jgi:2-polyprenyl-3-methyl-5-hydroxy-6-metoxy-1,4-benzoquinol methylase
MPTRIDEKPADVLDAWLAPLADDPAGAVAFLAEVADRVARHGGRVLALGGGSVADAMAGEGYAVTTADLDHGLPTGLRYDVVYVPADALTRFSVQREQLRLVRHLSRLLRPGGALVVQGQQPDPERWVADVWVAGVDSVRQTVLLTGAKVPVRYVWPAELDLMAELADLALDSRWGGWYGEPVECGGPVVSVFRS